MIQINKPEGFRIIELGGGANRNPASDINVDVRACFDANGKPTTDFQVNFEEANWPISDNEWDCVFSHFLMEHISYTKIPQFLKEILRILKPGGRAIIATANTEAQVKWLVSHPEGWDGKDSYVAGSELLFGSQDYTENAHKNFFSPSILTKLFQDAGFENILIRPYGDRHTDICIEAIKPMAGQTSAWKTEIPVTKEIASKSSEIVTESSRIDDLPKTETSSKEVIANVLGTNTAIKKEEPKLSREEMYDKDYFNGGGKVGGYAREGYWDYPIHEVTARHVLARKPESVLEIGAARGYILKRIQDAGIRANGLEISKHCWMTRVADEIRCMDICKTPWDIQASMGGLGTLGGVDSRYDLCFSIATMEHIPEEHLPSIIGEMQRTCKRGFHGIDFGGHDDGFDKTHCTLKSKDWWIETFNKYAPGWPVEIVDKEELEQGELPADVIRGDGKVKLNVGSFTTMHHHGWVNIDVHDLAQYAQAYKYNYMRHDVRNGLPFATSGVDFIMANHFYEHLTYQEGIAFLKECRRVLKADGVIRIVVPDADLLLDTMRNLIDENLNMFNEISEGCAKAKTQVAKLWELLFSGHQAAYDSETLELAFKEAGLIYNQKAFRQGHPQILRETNDMQPELSLIGEGTIAEM